MRQQNRLGAALSPCKKRVDAYSPMLEYTVATRLNSPKHCRRDDQPWSCNAGLWLDKMAERTAIRFIEIGRATFGVISLDTPPPQAAGGIIVLSLFHDHLLNGNV